MKFLGCIGRIFRRKAAARALLPAPPAADPDADIAYVLRHERFHCLLVNHGHVSVGLRSVLGPCVHCVGSVDHAFRNAALILREDKVDELALALQAHLPRAAS